MASRKTTLSKAATGSTIIIPGLLLHDDSLAYRCRIAQDFILDTGAEICLVEASSIALLSTFTSLTITGVGGTRSRPVDSGFLVIEPPCGAILPLRVASTATVGNFSLGSSAMHYASLCAQIVSDGVIFNGEPTVEPDAATIASAAVCVARVRATVFPPA